MKTFLRGCASLLLALTLLAATAYVVHGLHGAAEVAQAEQRAADEVAEALPASEARALRTRAAVRAAVANRWGRPAYAWQELVCDLGTVDSGWIVQSYTQECRVRSVDLVPADPTGGDECEWLSLPALDPAAEGSSVPRFSVDARRGPTSAFDEDHPFEKGCPDGIVAPPGYVTSTLLSGTRPATLSGAPAWVVITVDTEVSRTDLGCHPWALVFCTAPVDEPVLGDVG